jgi:hypothetical protein
MFTKVLATSVLAIGLATSAMAQSNDANNDGNDAAGGVPAAQTPEQVQPPAPDAGTTTNSTTQDMNKNCPDVQQSADASTTPKANDHSCDK